MSARPAFRRAAAGAALVLVAALPAAAARLPGSGVVLQGLNKVTTRISTIRAPIGEAVRFGGLEIVARYCEKSPPEEPPEVAAFLEVRDRGPAAKSERLFSGWMFASTPGVSALEHPIYDLWVLDCVDAAPPPSPAPSVAPGKRG